MFHYAHSCHICTSESVKTLDKNLEITIKGNLGSLSYGIISGGFGR